MAELEDPHYSQHRLHRALARESFLDDDGLSRAPNPQHPGQRSFWGQAGSWKWVVVGLAGIVAAFLWLVGSARRT